MPKKAIKKAPPVKKAVSKKGESVKIRGTVKPEKFDKTKERKLKTPEAKAEYIRKTANPPPNRKPPVVPKCEPKLLKKHTANLIAGLNEKKIVFHDEKGAHKRYAQFLPVYGDAMYAANLADQRYPWFPDNESELVRWDAVLTVAVRMLVGIAFGNGSKDGIAFQVALKHFGVENKWSAIRNWFNFGK